MDLRHKSPLLRILLIGADVSRLSAAANLLTQAGYDADFVCNSDDAIRRVAVPRYHLALVTDSLTPDEQLAMRHRLRQGRPQLPVLLQTTEYREPAALIAAIAASLRSKSAAVHILGPALVRGAKIRPS